MVKSKEIQSLDDGIILESVIPEEYTGLRLDKALAMLFQQYSRAAIQQWIRETRVSIDGQSCEQRQKVHPGQAVVIKVPAPVAADWPAQDIALDIIYEDEDILVINKPAGLVVHPGTGNPHSTLLNALLYYDQSLALLPRAGIVHRLDKDTTGLMVVGRNDAAVTHLVTALQARQVTREYLAIIDTLIVAGGTIEAPIARHRRDRVRMAVSSRGKQAVTHFRVEEKFRSHSLLRVILDTGRTHQIRVHMAWKGHPLVGDPLYGRRLTLPPAATETLVDQLRGFRRQALHAETLALIHPASGKQLSWSMPVPADMQQLIDALRNDRRSHASH